MYRPTYVEALYSLDYDGLTNYDKKFFRIL